MDMLGTLDADQKKDWKRFLGPLTYAYNCIRHETTGYSPFELMFGRQPRLPVDLVLGLGDADGTRKVPEYAKDLRKRMAQSFELASKKAKEAQRRQKVTYDLRARHAFLDIGDRVLVKILAFEGRHKLANRWESDVYVVVGQDNQDIPVYQVQKENGEGRIRTLHRNHLLPVGSLPFEEKHVEVIRPRPVPRMRNNRNLRGRSAIPDPEPVSDHHSLSDGDDDSSDDMGEDVVPYIPRPPIPSRRSDFTPESISEPKDRKISGNEVEEFSGIEDEPEADAPPVVTATPVNDPLPLPPPQTQPPEPAIRRSTRERKAPDWMRSGDYVCSQQTTLYPPEWERKAGFLVDLISGGMFYNMSETVQDALLQILKT